LQAEFWQDVRVPGVRRALNPELDYAHRVADFLELGELMCVDALNRQESCGCHFRAEFQTAQGEAQRHDDQYAYVAAWEFQQPQQWQLHPEALTFELAKFSQRSYQ
jgi:succinate dehydrogenase / fumarate reductase flavoprotein subunit